MSGDWTARSDSDLADETRSASLAEQECAGTASSLGFACILVNP